MMLRGVWQQGKQFLSCERLLFQWWLPQQEQLQMCLCWELPMVWLLVWLLV
jgi:hypothetical protein